MVFNISVEKSSKNMCLIMIDVFPTGDAYASGCYPYTGSSFSVDGSEWMLSAE